MFTVQNQIGNRISTTTSQTVNHKFFANEEISILGSTTFKVWRKRKYSLTQIGEYNTLEEAIELANKLIYTL